MAASPLVRIGERDRGLPLVLAAMVFLGSLLVALRSALAGTDHRLVYAVDDAYIHMAMAKNLAREGVWGCTPFHFSSSSSSVLWTLILAGTYRVFGVQDTAPLALNVALALLSLVLAECSLRRFGVAPAPRAAALLGIVIGLPLAGMVLMGMEHILHLGLTLWFAGAVVEALRDDPRDAQPRNGQTIGLSALGALLGASRYEGFFLVGLACLAFAVRHQLPRAIAMGAAAFLPVATLGAISVGNGSFFLPNSLMLKAAGETGSVLSALVKGFGREDMAFFHNNRGLLILAALGLVGAFGAWRGGGRFWRPPVLLPLLSTLMILLHGHYVFSPTYWAYRYDAYLVGFGIWVAAVVLAHQSGRGLPWSGRVPALLVAALVLIVADVREGLSPQTEIEGMRNTYLEHYQTADFVRRYYPSAAVVVNDLGAVSYYTEARILDLVGLGDVEPLQFLRRGDYSGAQVQAWTAKYQPAIAIIQLGWSFIVPRVPREWIKVAEVEVPTHHQRVGFFAVDPRESWSLRASVDQHFGPLGRHLGYRTRLKRPPD